MNAVLDIIMARRNENINGMENFLDMLEKQRKIDKRSINVTLIQLKNEEKDDIDLNVVAEQYPLNIKVKKADTDNLAKAYNTAIEETDCPWVMFMDYGDIFCDVYSLGMVVNLLPTDEADIIWLQYYNEFAVKDNIEHVGIIADADPEVTGKLIRKKYLIDNNIRFDEKIEYGIGRIFIETAQSMTFNDRFLKLTTNFVTYSHTYKHITEKLSVFEVLNQVQKINIACVKSIEKHIQNSLYIDAIMKTICDAYFYLNVDSSVENLDQLEQEIIEFYKEYAHIIERIKPQDYEVFIDSSQTAMMALIQMAYMQYGLEIYFDVDDLPMNVWIEQLRKKTGMKKINIPKSVKTASKTSVVSLKRNTKSANNIDKVAVYCGTRNLYDSMEASAKSLMTHTRMSRIYFLIEDDAFPRTLPDCVKCINVSGQKFFSKNGKNYNNAWTYMCLMRAAFCKLLPNENLVLSLDADVVVNEDVSELWDIDMSNYYLAGVKEQNKTNRTGIVHINFGVVMMNLEKLRKDKLDDKIIESLNNSRWGCPEQDAFNHFCRDKILEIDPMYNSCVSSHITGESDIEKISHYAGIKYWKHFKPFRKYASMNWDDVLKEDVSVE